jgi:16S rRNA (cytosine1407-C5)-methyltransferase
MYNDKAMKYEHYEQEKRGIFLNRLTRVFQTDRSFVEKLLSIEFRKSIRVNTLKVTDEKQLIKEIEAVPTKLIKIPWAKHCYIIDEEDPQLSRTSYFDDGLIYIQNASSLLPSILLDPQEGERILDMCAAPGGKSTHIAALTNNNAQLWVNDSSYLRVQKMAEILYRYGVKTKEVLIKRAEEITVPPEKLFDRILLDAQCSGEGMINLQHPRAMQYWSMSRIRKFQTLQKQMIDTAYTLLKPGGTLVYSTCTFAPEENEIIIDGFLRRHQDMVIEGSDIDLEFRMPGLTKWENRILYPDMTKAIRVLPNLYMEGFFVCKMKKSIS